MLTKTELVLAIIASIGGIPGIISIIPGIRKYICRPIRELINSTRFRSITILDHSSGGINFNLMKWSKFRDEIYKNEQYFIEGTMITNHCTKNPSVSPYEYSVKFSSLYSLFLSCGNKNIPESENDKETREGVFVDENNKNGISIKRHYFRYFSLTKLEKLKKIKQPKRMQTMEIDGETYYQKQYLFSIKLFLIK